MSWSDRRYVVLGSLALPLLAACGLEPALAPGNAGLSPLYGQVSVEAPSSPASFILVQQLEDRLGRARGGAPFQLDYSLRIDSQRLGTDRQGDEQRIQLEGRVRYALRRRGEDGTLASGNVVQFTGYSTTANTVSTRAAENDARQRLAIMLADGVVERLLLASSDLPL